jgi:hypothetical protein
VKQQFWCLRSLTGLNGQIELNFEAGSATGNHFFLNDSVFHYVNGLQVGIEG